jgi:hypothetical protein
VNTDFAETDVDTRRTNLTRFPLFFPEKRTFFLEGSDTFSFGLGLGQDVIPFFSRRIGLVSGAEVPIIAGGKINGHVGDTNVGGLVVGTNDKSGIVDERSMMSAVRVKQNIWSESWVGAIATTGDPLGRPGAALGGVDFTYATSRFRGNKNLRIGGWGLVARRQDLGRDATVRGLMIEYPNDEWDVWFNYKRIGRNFDPSLGFVPRRGVQYYGISMDNRARIARGPLQQLTHQFRPSVWTDLGGRWESYRVFIAPINWRFRSGDRVEFNVNPTGERLIAPFTVSDVPIPPGTYQWRQYRLEAGTAQKRRLYTQLTWWFGGFYSGDIDQVIWSGAWNPTALLTIEFTDVCRPATLRRISSATACGSTCRRIFQSRATCSTTRRANPSAPTRGCGGRSVPSPISLSSTITTSDRFSTAGSWIQTSFWSSSSTHCATEAPALSLCRGRLWSCAGLFDGCAERRGELFKLSPCPIAERSPVAAFPSCDDGSRRRRCRSIGVTSEPV